MKTPTQMLTRQAARSARLAELDLRIALGAAAEDDSPAYAKLFDMLEPMRRISETLDALAGGETFAMPEATLPKMTVKEVE